MGAAGAGGCGAASLAGVAERCAGGADAAAQGGRGAAAGEPDPEGRVRLFRPGTRPDPATVTRFIEERRGAFGVEPICRVLGVAVSTFYARRSRKPSRRELADRELVGKIHAARAGYRRAYGVRKTWKE